ncbi:YxcD family protein [Terrilactibacillus laevilacticus]|uniref:YxcD family protein n=1 Tax=Terrilactibacillus laevilacticus TaxID=1380157 RepID=A0ABW5PUZ4_9BACI|nr:YxcD family protein [Terrilactibacillus laevilacticus]
MGEQIITEQDIINAICLFQANKKDVRPETVEAELIYDDEYGFSAETYVNGRKIVLIESNLIEAIRYWLDTEMGVDPYSAALELVLDDDQGIIAYMK